MKIYNSLSHKIEEFNAINPPKVGMYTCGPTVYDYASIGNWRTYVLSDVLYRVLKFQGFEVTYVMNITDVGHLTGDNLGDADQGQDRIEKGSERERKTAWEIADFYTKDFLSGFSKLNLLQPDFIPLATDHISEQIAMIELIEAKGFAYRLADGLYFDIQAYEKLGHKYGELSSLDQIKEGARVEINPQKKDTRDFALWKFTPKGQKRQMEWDSPWGKGFPGWHIECSAMSMKYLGEQFDIHVGGEDLRSTHHPNEIAQSEAATGKSPFVRYWVHGAFLLVDGGRMGKSLGNAYTLEDIKAKSFDYLALRYFYLTGHYRKQLNFTWSALEAAHKALERLRYHVVELRNIKPGERNQLSQDKLEKVDGLRDQFVKAVNDDLNIPQALAVMWETVKSSIPSEDKLDLLYLYDEVLGLGIKNMHVPYFEIPKEVLILAEKRTSLRRENKFAEADKIRIQLQDLGWEIVDEETGPKLKPVKRD